MPDHCAPARVAAIAAFIPRPPTDVAAMRFTFSRIVSEQWEKHVPQVLATCGETLFDNQFAKARFIAQMYARACYSMLLLSGTRPLSIALPLRTVGSLPLSRSFAVRLGRVFITRLGLLLPGRLHRQLLLSSALMGVLDVILDDAVMVGQAAALRIANLVTRPAPERMFASERMIVTLANAARQDETSWQKQYWERVLQPAVHDYCLAEALAVQSIPDPQGMGHRWAGIDAAIKGMWYAVGPAVGLDGDLSLFETNQWNREQRWMADTSLLMQIIDDWVDQDEDRDVRLTSVVSGEWTLQSAAQLYSKTIRDLVTLLKTSGIRSPALQAVVSDLYKDYLHAAMDAMSSGLAA